jgi:hypothetical protein
MGYADMVLSHFLRMHFLFMQTSVLRSLMDPEELMGAYDEVRVLDTGAVELAALKVPYLPARVETLLNPE